MMIAFAFSLSAQKVVYYDLVDADTLEDVDTLDAQYPGIINADMYYSVQIVCDSVSGALNGTIYLQQSNSPAAEAWTNVSGKTVVLGQGAVIKFEGLLEGGATPFLAPKLRLYSITSGTGETTCNAWLVLKQKN